MEFVMLVLALFGQWDAHYYPSFLPHDEVQIDYHQDETIITVKRNLSKVMIACTGSMHPMMGCNNEALVEELSQDDEVNIGDIVVYENDDSTYIMHQVIGIDEGCYELKGFNNIFNDRSCVTRNDIKLRAVVVLPTKGA